MILVDSSCKSDNSPSCVLIPIWRSQSGKSRDNITAACVFDFSCHIVRIGRRIDESHFIPQPLYRGSRNKYGAFKGVGYLPIHPPRYSSYKPVIGKDRLVPGVHKQKTSRTVCILGITFGKAGLSEQCCLLVSRRACYRYRTTEEGLIGLPVYTAVRHGLRHHTLGDIQFLKNLSVPVECIDVKEHCSACIGIVSDMNTTLCKLPYKPCFNSSEQKLALFGTLPCSRNIFKYPVKFCCRKISIYYKSRLLAKLIGQPLFHKCVAEFACSSALPYDGITDRITRVFVPDDCCLPLVGNSNGGNLFRHGAGFTHCLNANTELRRPYLIGIMLNPAGFRKNLCEFFLCYRNDLSFPVKKNRSVTCGSGVNRHYIFLHKPSPLKKAVTLYIILMPA